MSEECYPDANHVDIFSYILEIIWFRDSCIDSSLYELRGNDKSKGANQMNLTDLFNQQRKLDEEIERKHPGESADERIYKKNLALIVELGELANEQRSWKFWSSDRRPRTDETIYCSCDEGIIHWGEGSTSLCEKCDGDGILGNENLVLNEYVDCLHFILSIGNYINAKERNYTLGRFYKEENITKQFLMVFDYATKLQHDDYYEELMKSFLYLGEMLGFTQRQIEQAYNDKNKTNWERQANGY